MSECLTHPTLGYYMKRDVFGVAGEQTVSALRLLCSLFLPLWQGPATSSDAETMLPCVHARAGDFVTSPEVSQMFGELMGIWRALRRSRHRILPLCLLSRRRRRHTTTTARRVVSLWEQLGRPPTLKFIELGPGRGTLAADALRATAGFAGFREALEVHLVEVSPALRQIQVRGRGAVGLRAGLLRFSTAFLLMRCNV